MAAQSKWWVKLVHIHWANGRDATLISQTWFEIAMETVFMYRADKGVSFLFTKCFYQEEEVVTEPTVEVTTSAVQPRVVNHQVQPTVNGHIVHEPPTYEQIVRKPMPMPEPKPQRRLELIEQSVLISPTLQAPKRRMNYTGMRLASQS